MWRSFIFQVDSSPVNSVVRQLPTAMGLRMRFLPIIFIVCVELSIPAWARPQAAPRSSRRSYDLCTERMRSDPQSAYEICGEYLRKYPNDDDRLVRFVREWITSYEKVQPYIKSLRSLAPSDSAASWLIYEPDLSVYIPEVVERDGNHPVETGRSFDGAGEEAMLMKAEAVYPAADKIIGKILSHPWFWAGNLPDGDGPIWWEGGKESVLSAEVVTASAVRYYYELSQSLRRDPKLLINGFEMWRTSFKYAASIKYHEGYARGRERFTDVYVADLNLEWSHTCGGLCGRGFKRNKVVVLNRGGEVLAMFLDAPENRGGWDN